VGLWVLFFLSALALAVRSYVEGQVELARRISGRDRAYYAARAGVERAISIVDADTNGWDATTERWGRSAGDFRDIPCGEGTFTISHVTEQADGSTVTNFGLDDEQGRIDINQAGVDMLRALLEVAGEMDPQAAAKTAQAIGEQRTPEADRAGGDRIFPAGLGLRAGPFDSIYALLLLDGMVPPVFERIRDHVTVCGGFRVNINTADRLVLLSAATRAATDAATRGVGEGLVTKILRFREAGNVFTGFLGAQLIDSLASSTQLTGQERELLGRMAPVLTVRTDTFRGTVGGRFSGDPAQRREITFVWDRKHRKIRSWHED
jgi:type II secretory pathway component PulK